MEAATILEKQFEPLKQQIIWRSCAPANWKTAQKRKNRRSQFKTG
jgi:hypothetical protein